MGFILSFLVALIAVTILGLPFLWLFQFLGYGRLFLLLELGLSAVIGIIFGAVSLVMYAVWRATTQQQQLVLSLVFLLVGAALMEAGVELDIIGFIGLALTYGGVQKGRPLGSR